MIDALLDILPPGSMVDQDAMQFRDAGLFKRLLNLPVRIPPSEPVTLPSAPWRTPFQVVCA